MSDRQSDASSYTSLFLKYNPIGVLYGPNLFYWLKELLQKRNVLPQSGLPTLSTASSDKSFVDIVLSSIYRMGSSVASFPVWGATPYGDGQSAEQQEVSVGSLPSILPSHRHISPSSLRLNMNGLSRDPHNWNDQEMMRFFRNNKDWLMNLQIDFDTFIEELLNLSISGEEVLDPDIFDETFLEEHLKVKQGMGRKRLMKLVKKLRESYSKPVMKAHAGDHKAQDNTGVSIEQGDHNTNNVTNVHHHYSGKINTINHRPFRFAHDQGPQEI